MDIVKFIYNAAKDGKLKRIQIFLSHLNKDEVGEVVSAKTNGATPLVIACRNGHYDVAEYLIEECQADIEQSGVVMFDGETIESAPPLWCAAAAGHLALVRLLVSKGADVNSITWTHSTPLRAACYDGHFEIVKFLVENGADIEVANRHGHTCLMITCYKGHIRIAKYLLAAKADVNRKSVKGNTALHDCAESGSLEILKILIKHGARLDVDYYGMTPLLAAAVTGHVHIVKYLIGMSHIVSRKEKIDALELLGSTCVDKKRNLLGALGFWKRAMKERYEGDGPVIAKPTPSTVEAAYDFACEVTDPDALDDLLADPDEMRMQALLIRERILGPAHPDTSYFIRYRGAVYADAGKYRRCIDLWNYALTMQQTMLEPLNPMTQCSLFSFTELFRFMIEEKGQLTNRGCIVPPVQRKDLMHVFQKAVLEVTLGKQMLDEIPACERDLTYLNRVLLSTLHLACLLTRETPEEGTEDYVELHKAVYKLLQINAKGKQGRDVLQLTFSDDTILANRQYRNCIFPTVHLTKTLLKVGADVTAKDNDGNTALHLAALSFPWRTDLATTLLDAGAHLDAVNNEGKTFEMILMNKNRFDLVNPVKYTTLACLAARVVKKTYEITMVPQHLRAFVRMH